MKRQKQKQSHHKWQLSPRIKRLSLLGVAIICGLLILFNGVLLLVYRDRTYPGTKVTGASIGSIGYDQIAKRVDDMKLLPPEVTFTYAEQTALVKLSEFGIEKDTKRSVESADGQRSWLPMINLFRSPELKAPIKIDTQIFDAKISELAKTLRKDTANARLALNGATVTIQQESNGFELEKSQMQQTVLKGLDTAKRSISVPVKITSPKIKAASLTSAKQSLEAQLQTPINLNYNQRSKRVTAEDIAQWFVQAGETYTLDSTAITVYVNNVGKEFSIRVKDSTGIASKIKDAVANQKPYTATLVAQTASKTFTYCVAAKGVSASHLPTFRNMLATTFGHSQGWSINGLVDFQEVANSCNFTAWLSAADQMPSFGAICDSMWSCRVGPNVVINFDRWQNASPAWNANGGSLDNYRHMVINHETGHWLSFGHSHCEGAGQPAPVMQQQSINLEGCTFNPWPTASELLRLRQKLGI